MLLQSLDAIIAFTTIMLVLSLMITALVQLVISLLGLRGRDVLWGLEQLLQRTVPAAERAAAGKRAREVLAHPALSTSTNYLRKGLEWLYGRVPGRLGAWLESRSTGGKRPPSALHANDVLLVLSDLDPGGKLAEGLGAAQERAAAAGLDADTAKELVAKLGELMPEKKAAVEAAVDELQAKARRTAARAEATVQRFEDWFELTMDAAAERLKLRSRWITVLFALVMAFGLRVDSIDIMHQLLDKPELAAQVLAQAAEVQAVAADLQGGNTTREGRQAVEELSGTVKELKQKIEETGLDVFRPFDGWDEARAFYFGTGDAEDVKAADAKPAVAELAAASTAGAGRGPRPLGILVSVLLLSMGAPFWSGALSKLLGFRAILRKRQEKGREAEGSAAGGG